MLETDLIESDLELFGSIGMAVYVPCPISTLCIVNVTVPSRSMRMNALGVKGAALLWDHMRRGGRS